MSTFSPVKAAVVLAAIGVGFAGLVGRVAYLQTAGRQATIAKAERQQHMSESLLARRGTIFDTNGNVLAATVQTKVVFVDPKFLLQQVVEEGIAPDALDQKLARIAHLLDKDPADLRKLIDDKRDKRYVRLAEKVDEATAQAVAEIDLPGIGFQTDSARHYPMGSLAAHVLGGVGKDSNGLEGVELKFNRMLSGKDGFKRTLKDARRRSITVAAEDYLPPMHGQHLVLTLDANIQMIAEEELAATCRDFKAQSAEAVVMDPRTGEVLALACWPAFNPQNLEDSTQDVRRNRCLTDPYEPGSTLKPFLVGPALGWRVTRPNEMFNINGPTYRTHYGRRITDVHPYQRLSTWDVLVKSSNIGTCMIAERLGNARLHAALKSFQFGEATNIELPGEHPGRVNPLKRWTKYSTHSVAQGYELMVTPLQLARAFSAYANGGRMVQPRLVKGLLDPSGEVVAQAKPAQSMLMPQVVEASTASEMKQILSDVPVRGTASRARSRIYNVFGKTGTAHKAKGGSYNQSDYTSSFIGAAPLEDPRLVIAFIIHNPDRSIAHYGGTVSAPGAVRVLERSLAYLQVPESPDLLPPPPQISDTLYAFNPKMYAKPKRSLLQPAPAVSAAGH